MWGGIKEIHPVKSVVKRLFVGVASAAALVVSMQAYAAKMAKSPNLVEVAIAVNSAGPYAGQFSTLIGLVASDDEILNTLTERKQYTVFAPTNDAFTALFDAAAKNCLDLTPQLVNAVLKYHVAKGRRDSTQVLDSSRIRTLLDAFFFQTGGIITDGAGQTVNFVETDIPATNGVIHAIDTVLLPFPVTNQCP
jgi:uncharacterized surface protein with fasciclin (FAS1) repeats